tara:strand:+ start:2655 stop:3386 length:732 start_codon:yes stop_codon:yes gene_type:complete
MFRFNFFSSIIKTCIIFFCLISSRLAISENFNNESFLKFKNQLNQRNLAAIEKYFEDDEKLKFENQFYKLIDEFPNAKWEIKNVRSTESDQYNFEITVKGFKLLNEKKFTLKSKFNFIFLFKNGTIKNSRIINNLTTIRNDNNKVDIDISIPSNVLTGANYNLDVIIKEPLGEKIIAGGIKEHQEGILFDQSVLIEPLSSGGIFKVTRAPLKPGLQVWTGFIAHPNGLISFTKSVNIIDNYSN